MTRHFSTRCSSDDAMPMIPARLRLRDVATGQVLEVRGTERAIGRFGSAGVGEYRVAEARVGMTGIGHVKAGNDETGGEADSRHLRDEVAHHRWQDATWMQQRLRDEPRTSPLSIYRLQARAWRRDAQGLPLAWPALAASLVPYVADLGFTHIELRGLDEAEANIGFARFVDACHDGGIGVIVEWPLAIPPVPMAEDEVIAQALEWLEQFHLDGLRLMPLSPQEDADSVALLGKVMATIAAHVPDVVLFCEYRWTPPAVDPSASRLLLWNTHWSRALVDYLSHPPEARGAYHDTLTGVMAAAFNSHFILPLVDEAWAVDTTWFGCMPGTTEQRLASLRACLGFMWAHPGKKLLSMGAEFANGRVWQQDGELDWTLLDQSGHAGVQRLVADLNRIYGNEPSLHYRDGEPDSFAWVVGDDSTNSVVAFMRYGAEGTAPLLVVTNFGPSQLHHYRLGVPALGTWREILNTDSVFYAGENVGNGTGVSAQLTPSHGYPASLELTLPALTTLLLRQGDWPT